MYGSGVYGISWYLPLNFTVNLKLLKKLTIGEKKVRTKRYFFKAKDHEKGQVTENL